MRQTPASGITFLIESIGYCKARQAITESTGLWWSIRVRQGLTYPSGFDLLGEMKPKSEITKYLASIGRKGGKITSEAKTKAARKNAKKGGWPKGRPRKPRDEK